MKHNLALRGLGAGLTAAAVAAAVAVPALAAGHGVNMKGTCPPPPNTKSTPTGVQTITCTVKGSPLGSATFVQKAKIVGSDLVGTCSLKGGGKSLSGKLKGPVRINTATAMVTTNATCTITKGGHGSFKAKSKAKVGSSARSSMALSGKLSF